MIYFFCGHRGCGKNYLASQIIRGRPMKIIDTGPIIRNAYKKYNKEGKKFKEWMSDNEKKYGENFSNKLICKSSQINVEKDYIVIGYRSLQGIDFFNQFFNIDKFKIVFIDGDYELFRKNYNMRENLNISQKEYERIIEIENSMGIEEIQNFAKKNSKNAKYFYKTQNDNSIFDSLVKDMGIVFEEIER